jgi:CIC family chloride channel protein
MGAALGDAFGQAAGQLVPAVAGPAGAYALVGMAAVFGGAAHAPATAILIVFEMTRDYRMILPLMLTMVMSTLISRVNSRESIYTLKLSRRGVRLQYGQDVDLMQGILVSEAMTTELEVVPPEMSLEELADESQRTHHHGFPVVNEHGDLVGIVSLRDLERAVAGGPLRYKKVGDISTTKGLMLAYPDEPMWEALRRLGTRDLSRLPAVEARGSRRLVGVIRRRDMVRAYNQAILNCARHQHRVDALRLGRLDHAIFSQITIPENAAIVGKRVSELGLPQECLIVSLRGGRKLQVAHGHTMLRAGDQLTVFADEECLPIVQEQLIGGTKTDTEGGEQAEVDQKTE